MTVFVFELLIMKSNAHSEGAGVVMLNRGEAIAAEETLCSQQWPDLGCLFACDSPSFPRPFKRPTY